MSGRDDDVFDLADLRAGLGRVRGVGGDSVLLGVALAVIAVCLALALVPHVMGAVGADAVDRGSSPGPTAEAPDEARERYKNYLANLVLVFAPALIPMVAVGVAFAGALRGTGTRTRRVGTVVAGAAVGVTVGYAGFVLVAHLAFAEAAEGYFVDEFPVTIRWWTLAVNALAIATVAVVGSAVAAIAGTLVAPTSDAATARPGAGSVDASDDAAASGDGDDHPDVGGSEDARIEADDDATDRDRQPDERPTRIDDASGSAASDSGPSGSAASDSGPSGPASDYRETGPGRSSGSRTPTYDPDGRNWDGSGDDAS